jgi:hypothetical protein
MSEHESGSVSARRDSESSSPDYESEEGRKIKQPNLRRILTEEDAIAIFSAGKPRTGTSTVKIWARGQILELSRKFNVTPKTIRDIWNRRTWRDVTLRLIVANKANDSPYQVLHSNITLAMKIPAIAMI